MGRRITYWSNQISLFSRHDCIGAAAWLRCICFDHYRASRSIFKHKHALDFGYWSGTEWSSFATCWKDSAPQCYWCRICDVQKMASSCVDLSWPSQTSPARAFVANRPGAKTGSQSGAARLCNRWYWFKCSGNEPSQWPCRWKLRPGFSHFTASFWSKSCLFEEAISKRKENHRTTSQFPSLLRLVSRDASFLQDRQRRESDKHSQTDWRIKL